MDTEHITYICSLTTSNIKNSTLKVKLLSVWNTTCEDDPYVVTSIEMLMVDEQVYTNVI